MKQKNLNKIIYLFILLFLNISILYSEEETIDIWKKNNKTDTTNESSVKKKITNVLNQNIDSKINTINKESKITESINDLEPQKIIFGTIDPEINDLKLNMWSNSNGNDIKNIFKRIDKINLSKTTEEMFINIIMTYS